MLMIRLQRVGRKNDPSFRLVVTEKTNAAKKSGRFAEILGNYDARKGQPTINAERVNHWFKMGAQPSVTAHNLLVKHKIIAGQTRNPLPKKTVIAKVEEAKAAPTNEVVGAPTDNVGAETAPVEAV